MHQCGHWNIYETNWCLWTWKRGREMDVNRMRELRGRCNKKWTNQEENRKCSQIWTQRLCLPTLCWASFGQCGADVPTLRTQETRSRSGSSLVWGCHRTAALREGGRSSSLTTTVWASILFIFYTQCFGLWSCYGGLLKEVKKVANSASGPRAYFTHFCPRSFMYESL